LISSLQNNLKTPKYINLKQKKNKTKLIFFKNTFETQKQTRFYKTQLKKYTKTSF